MVNLSINGLYPFHSSVTTLASVLMYLSKKGRKEAADYGGRAINIAQTTAAHAMSYKITSMYKLPHGHAVAVCLPEIWQYMLDNMDKCIDSRGKNCAGTYSKPQ